MKSFLSLILFMSMPVLAATFNSNIAAYFSSDEVKVMVASNTDCSNIGLTKAELSDMIDPAINDYWNTVTTSRLKLKNGGYYQTSNALFNTGLLCGSGQSGCTSANESQWIPKVTGIVISCNSNSTSDVMFPASRSGIYGFTLPNNYNDTNLLGSVIVINSSSTSKFDELSYAQQVVVIAHEIGHAVGIGHMRNQENIMYYTLTPERFALGPDDVDAMTYLYPKKIDGCGLITSIKDKADDDNFYSSFLIGILSSIFLFAFLVLIQKFIFKLQKAIL
ncbi:MAG: matrixin family metalloprotease [Halobacteriovoraceae bacterium]|nr:matrixin family metalloprotease [Halobacteriovoraceae bacterium]MCB9093814.1 matrixin family metalloprotease [Halobacteriovoraceae bacterium]